MKKVFITVAVAFIWISFSSIFSGGCTKETIKEFTHDTVIFRDTVIKIVNKDSLTIVKNFMTKKWTFVGHELETYSGGVLISKKYETFTGFSAEYRANGTATYVDLGGTSNGTWQLLSPSYYVVDANTAGERYYYIISISDNNLISRGPFTKTNTIYSNFLTTTYLKK
ncbi:MAG: hypothetical protein H7Y27_00605 [Gemmatimonadaceae bacterium]|nr:hypothetical protein [Chitinophagaceae bacterium]